MLQVGHLLIDGAEAYPDRLAIVNKTNALTYKELNRLCNCVANGLRNQGVSKGDRVAALLKNSVEWVITWYACQKLGAVFVPLHIRFRARELAEMMKVAESSVLVFPDEFEDNAMEIAELYPNIDFMVRVGEKKINDTDYKIIPWSSFIDAGDDMEAQVTTDNEDPSLLLFTSGTTGEPKGVLKTQEAVMLHAICMALRNNSPLNVQDVMMSAAPLYHIGGLQGLIKMHLIGGTYITLNGIVPEVVFNNIEKYKVTQLQMLPPVTYERIYTYKNRQDYDLSSIWEVCVSAGKSTTEYIDHIFEMFPTCHLRPSWGSTEACSITSMQITKNDLERDPGLIKAVGSVMPMTEVRIVGENGRDVKPGETGEALVRSPMVFKGYLKKKNKTVAALSNDGWFRTGDIMRFDQVNGYYYFIDRKKDVIKTGGENVFAQEIETIIQKHPAILDCAVVGVPDERFGEAIAAAVVLHEGCSITADELVAFCKEKLPSFKKPRYLAVVDKLPANAVGKVQKETLRGNPQIFKPIFD